MSAYGLLSLLFSLLFIGSSALILRDWKKWVFVKPRAVLSGQLAALVSQWAYGAVAQHPLELQHWLMLLAPGLALGVVLGRFVRSGREVRGIDMNFARPGAIIWTALMTLTQLGTVFTGSVPIIIFGLAVLSLGVNLGLSGKALLGYRRMLKQAAGIGGGVQP